VKEGRLTLYHGLNGKPLIKADDLKVFLHKKSGPKGAPDIDVKE